MTGVHRLPLRHWRSYGNDPLPTGAEALEEPFDAFPSWFLQVTCDRCGKVEDIEWYDVPKPATRSLGKRILRECELIFRGLCTKCAPRHASR